MNAFDTLAGDNLWVVIAFPVGRSRRAQNLAWTKLDADVAPFTAFGYEVNLSPRSARPLDVYGVAPVNLHTTNPLHKTKVSLERPNQTILVCQLW